MGMNKILLTAQGQNLLDVVATNTAGVACMLCNVILCATVQLKYFLVTL